MIGRGESLSLAHRPVLLPLLGSLALPLSEFSFANLFLFRSAHAWEFLPGPPPFLRGCTRAGEGFLTLLFDPRSADPGPLREAAREESMLFPIPEGWLSAFPRAEWAMEARRGDSDYLYRSRAMCELPGRRLHRRRSQKKRFEEGYLHQERTMGPAEAEAALRVLEGWTDEAGRRREETDYHACREAIALTAELGLSGAMVYAEGEPAGFVLGEGLTPDVYALHFAKGITRFEGIYPFLFSRAACLLPPGYGYLNLEQDLDKETLRAAKESYFPERLLPKYRLTLRAR